MLVQCDPTALAERYRCRTLIVGMQTTYQLGMGTGTVTARSRECELALAFFSVGNKPVSPPGGTGFCLGGKWGAT